jgi:hypothetical protein
MLTYCSLPSSSNSSSSSAAAVFGGDLAGVDVDDREGLGITDVCLGAAADCIVAERGD